MTGVIYNIKKLTGRHRTSLGTLRNYDGDVKETRQKSNRFDEQNKYSARASRFFAHFFAVPAQLRSEMSKF